MWVEVETLHGVLLESLNFCSIGTEIQPHNKVNGAASARLVVPTGKIGGGHGGSNRSTKAVFLSTASALEALPRLLANQHIKNMPVRTHLVGSLFQQINLTSNIFWSRCWQRKHSTKAPHILSTTTQKRNSNTPRRHGVAKNETDHTKAPLPDPRFRPKNKECTRVH